jgi:hypothetical protein
MTRIKPKGRRGGALRLKATILMAMLSITLLSHPQGIAQQPPAPIDAQVANAIEGNKIQRHLVTVGWVQVGVYALQAALLVAALIATARQASIANRTFKWAHRPKIRVKHVWLKSDIWANQPVQVTAVVVNAGSARAVVKEWHFGTLILETARELPDDAKHVSDIVNLTVDSGITQAVAGLSDNRTLTEDDHAGIRSGDKTLYCFGRIIYGPALAEGIHTTAFCRKLVLRAHASVDDRGRFRMHDDPDYEYQD